MLLYSFHVRDQMQVIKIYGIERNSFRNSELILRCDLHLPLFSEPVLHSLA